MSLLHLPAELLHALCLFCSRNEIESLRLTCQLLKRIADEHLLDEIITCYEYNDLLNVSEIANDASPAIRENVRSFLFQADAFPAAPYWSRHHWNSERRKFFRGVEQETKDFMRNIGSRIKTKRSPKLFEALRRYYQCSIDPAMLPGREKAASHEDYIELAEEQEWFGEVGHPKRTLQSLFAGCPNIKSVAINSGHRLRRNAGLTNLAYLRSLTIPHCYQEKPMAYAVKTTFAAAANAGIKLESLAIGGVTPIFVRPTEDAGDKNEDDTSVGIPQNQLYELTSQLKNLRLIFLGEDDLGADMEFPFDEGHLVSWLSNCSRIEHLRLDLPPAPYPNWRVPFQHFLGENLHFSSLRLLHLESFQTRAEQLAQFLLRHKESLVELELSDIHLSSGSWPDCLALFAGKLENLRRARVRGFLTSFNDGSDEWFTFDLCSSHVELEQTIVEGGEIVLPPPLIDRDSDEDIEFYVGEDDDDEEY
ncbi:hypothetical protein AC578_4249 [Pseudocercospora eumusae]|uniref:F-box domain-containing protein n=1 Tax=Pseudocercospora eumusae TaxID=321146 RepID=A0A139HAQ8_9PEZI|nr:hypothetical protein AC578_4249 [Pseudocercospora eumusae]